MRGVAAVVVGVVREALRERGLDRVVVLDRPGAPVELLCRWIDAAGLGARVVARPPTDREALVLDPATKEVLLLQGPLPGAELLPLGDLWGSRARSEDPDRPDPPLEALERALEAAFDGGGGLGALDAHLTPEEAAEVRSRLLRTAPLLRPPVVPKLGAWTAGIDPGP